MKSGWIILFSCTFMACSVNAAAQSTAKLIEKGNRAYNKYVYNYAIAFYEDAIKNDTKGEHPEANYNLACALFMEKKYAEAAKQYQNFLHARPSDEYRALASYNLGICYLAQEKYRMSIVAFERALRINPDDNDARYNLVYAKIKLDAEENKWSKEKSKQNDSKSAGKFKIPDHLQRNKKLPGLSRDYSDNENDHGRVLTEQAWKEILKALTIDESATITQLQAVQNSPRRKRILKDW
jgi:tetratricopeptide (TPR) repeat protein